jgi:epoxyqueuosine reductase QueG
MKPEQTYTAWMDHWMQSRDVPLWGAADIRSLTRLPPLSDKGLPSAISWAVAMQPDIMAGIQKGPTQAYAQAYTTVNLRINEIAGQLAADIGDQGFQAVALAASERTDPVNIRGDFPHKTAATLAGIGWVGRHCQLVTRQFGPWVRLGTVFTNMPVRCCGKPLTRSFCGSCRACVDACPAGALTGKNWYPGIAREEILNPGACDQWKKTQYYAFNNGHNCGICSAVCPYGLRYLKRVSGEQYRS